MNYFSYEVLAKEKIKDCQDEGLRSQSAYRSGVPRLAIARSLPRLIPVALGIWIIFELVMR